MFYCFKSGNIIPVNPKRHLHNYSYKSANEERKHQSNLAYINKRTNTWEPNAPAAQQNSSTPYVNWRSFMLKTTITFSCATFQIGFPAGASARIANCTALAAAAAGLFRFKLHISASKKRAEYVSRACVPL